MDDVVFRKIVRAHWRKHGRHALPWRATSNPHHILVSEIMLQQTQVDRVIPFYETFLATFPTFRSLALAPKQKLLQTWQGLGYNRRALMLQRCAQEVVQRHRGKLPNDYEALKKLSGIGPYTAGAVMAFAFNNPMPVIETNIRRVYLHHYFPKEKSVSDGVLLPIVERTLDRRNPRQWYSALMDYGTYLAKQLPNPNRRSASYTRQKAFGGSVRQLRGQVVRALLAGGQTQAQLAKVVKGDERLGAVLERLSAEGFIKKRGMRYLCA